MKPRESEIGLSPLCSKTENMPRPPTRDSKPFISMHWWSTSTRLPASAASSKSQPTTYVFGMLSVDASLQCARATTVSRRTTLTRSWLSRAWHRTIFAQERGVDADFVRFRFERRRIDRTLPVR